AAASTDRPFSLVLTDHLMPDMDGFEVVLAMQSRPSLAQIPVILLSSAVDLDPAQARAVGFAAHLAKPIRQSALFDAIVRATSSGAPPAVEARTPASDASAPAAASGAAPEGGRMRQRV